MTLLESFESHGLLENQSNILAEDIMKYTTSRDGIERCTIKLEYRMTREDYAEMLKLAKATGRKSVREYLELSMLDEEKIYNQMQNDRHYSLREEE